MTSLKRKSIDGKDDADFTSVKIGRTTLTSSASSSNKIDINLITNDWDPDLAEVLTNKDLTDPSNTFPDNIVLTSGDQLINGEKSFTTAPLFDSGIVTKDDIIMENTGTSANIKNNAAVNRTVNLPASGGTLALISQVPTNTIYVDRSTAQGVSGAKTFNDIVNSNITTSTLIGCRLIDDVPLPLGGLKVSTADNNSLFDGVIKVPTLSSERTYTVPNNSGTVALISDVPTNSTFVDRTTIQTIAGRKTFLEDTTCTKFMSSNGAAALPAHSFTNATNCGMSYDPITNGLTLACNGNSVMFSRGAGFATPQFVIPFGRNLCLQRSDLGISNLTLTASGNDFLLGSNASAGKFLFQQNISNNLTGGGLLLRTGDTQENGFQVTDTSGVTISVNLNKLGSTTLARAALYLAPVIASVSNAQPYFTYFASPVITGTVVPTASTVVIQGPPSLGFVTNPYSLNVLSGNSIFGVKSDLLSMELSMNHPSV